MTREAELELEIARLREALLNVVCSFDGTHTFDWPEYVLTANDALSTPPSTTALQELIEKVERRTIERCAKAADELRHTDGFSAESADWCSGTIHAAYAIRALPTGNLKLEDL